MPNPEGFPFTIEPATDDDWPWIVEGQAEIVWAGLGSERQREVSREAVRENAARRVANIRREEGFPNQAFVARASDGQIAGFVWIARTHNDFTGELEASLLSQYVAAPYRGQGLGHRLMETAETWAREQHLPRISLSVSARSVIERKLHESLGYEVESLRMSKSLDDEDYG